LAAHGGQAPGPNGLTYQDLDEAAIWQLCQHLARVIKSGTYKPSRDRKVKIPKRDGVHFRTLRLQNIEDRVVQRAIVQIVQPLLDPRFSDRSHGFRPRRNRVHALAQAEHLASTQHHWVWLTEDLRDAFEHVPHGRLLNLLGRILPEKLLRLIERIIDNGRTLGIRQGAPLSPMLLNCYLDHHLDRMWHRRHPEIPLIRYADDLLLLCGSEPEANQARADLEYLLRPTGTSLKGTAGRTTRRLDYGQPADWLGFRIERNPRHEEDLVARIAEATWNQLDLRLSDIAQYAGTPTRAYQVVVGWMLQQGPCYPAEDRQTVYRRVEQLLEQHGYEDVLDERELPAQWLRAYDRYCQLRSRTIWPEPTNPVPPVAGVTDVPAFPTQLASASSCGSAAPF
jgi:hypothetical protein